MKTLHSAYGIRIASEKHPVIKLMKRENRAGMAHGDKLWGSDWLLMDYFHLTGMPMVKRVYDIGCGWGASAMYAAKVKKKHVVCVDADEAVFSYVRLHQALNNVPEHLLHMQREYFQRIHKHLRTVAQSQRLLVMGGDVCFWDKLIPAWKRIMEAVVPNGGTVVLTDPGRGPFDAVADYAQKKYGATLYDWDINRPFHYEGYVLVIGR